MEMLEIGAKMARILYLKDVNPRLDRFIRVVPEKFLGELIEEIKIWGSTTLEKKTQESLAGRILRRRTGTLAKKATWFQRGSKKGLILSLQTDRDITPYAWIHEYGGIIRAKNARYLTIPIPGREGPLTPAGVTRKSAAEYIRDPNEETFFAKSRQGNLILFRKKHSKTRDRVVPLFVLRKQVKMPQRKWASLAVQAALPDLQNKILADRTRLGKVIYEAMK